MTPESQATQEQLAAAGRKRDRSGQIRSALTIGVLVATMVLLVAVLDYWLMLPVWVRTVALLVSVGFLCAGAWKLIRRWRQPTSLKQAALDAEAASGAGCEISTAAEYLSDERKVTQEYERELVEALQRKAAVTLQQSPVPYGRRLVVSAMFAVVVLLGWLLFVGVVPSAGTALKRAAAPWSQAAFTRIEVRPGNVEIPVGRDLTLTNIFTGRRPAKAELRMHEAGRNDWVTVPLTEATNGVFRHTLKDVRGSFTYRVTGSDAVSDDFTVTAYVPPEVKDLRVQLDHPAYTKLKPAEQASPDIAVVRGSTATFRITPTVALARAQLRFTNGLKLELKADAGQLWTAPLPVLKDADYWFELFDAKGHQGGGSRTNHITAIPDAPPKVDLTEPGQDIRAAATDKIPLKLTASDDFGLTGVRIIYHRLDGPEQELVVNRKEVKDTEVQAEAELDLSTLKLREYELVAYQAEARDNNTLDGPGVGRSPVYFIEITNENGALSQSKGKPGQKVNLLVLQKQIIADTTALPKAAPADKYQELAARQKDAVEFGRMYQQALMQTGAPLPAQGEMNAAVDAMQAAMVALEQSRRDGALTPEERALASLYRVMKLMPELGNLPTVPSLAKQPPNETPPAVQVVLEAIKKQKQEPPNQEELTRALEEIQQLSRQQAGLSADQNSGSGVSGGGPLLSRASQSQAAAKSPGQTNQGKQGQEGKSEQQGQGKGQGNGQDGKEGEGPDGKEGSPPEAKELARLAPKEAQLSKQAQAIAERLARLAGKGSRLGHGAGKRMSEAASKMAQAAQAMQQGNGAAAGAAGDESSAALGAAMTMLENLLQGKTELSDVTAEDAPQQYEGAIAEYFKRLSHAQ